VIACHPADLGFGHLETEGVYELLAFFSNRDLVGIDAEAVVKDPARSGFYRHVASFDKPLDEKQEVGRPLDGVSCAEAICLEQKVDLELGEPIMGVPKICLVNSECLPVDFATVGPPVAVRAEGYEIFVLVRLALLPGNNVVNIDLNMAARWYRAAMTRFDQDTAP
jgi:hypothetical protein